MRKLTKLQELFCIKLFECSNATQAYEEVYDCGQVKKGTVHKNAWKLQSDPRIIKRVKTLRAKHELIGVINHKKLTDELSKIAFFDIAELYDEESKLKDIHELP